MGLPLGLRGYIQIPCVEQPSRPTGRKRACIKGKVESGRSMAESSPIPTLLAFLVCDTVIFDSGTGKRTLVGVFSTVNSPMPPPFAMAVGLYARLVEGFGEYEIKVRLVNLKDEAAVLEMKMKAEWKVADEPFELGININGVLVPEFGSFEFQLYANDVYIGRAVIKAKKLQLPPPQAAQGL